MTDERVALLHYTAPPAIGGVEDLLTLQANTLKELGAVVRVLTGNGAAGRGFEAVQISELLPSHPCVIKSLRDISGTRPEPDHPLVLSLISCLRRALKGCTQCWVHNVFTLALNPFASEAMRQMVAFEPQVRFVAWCADVSAASRFADSSPSREPMNVPDDVEVIAISHARARDLEVFCGVNPGRIRVVTPPLNVSQWMGLGQETENIVLQSQLLESEPVVFVPAKALPHKGIERAIDLAAALKERFSRPLVLVSAAPSSHEGARSTALLDDLQSCIDKSHLGNAIVLCSLSIGRAISRRTVRELALLSDVVYAPSEEEGYGMTLLEAMALRIPLICSDIPAFRECAGPVATYCSLKMAAEQVASLVAEAAADPANQARRRSTCSYAGFRVALQDILHGQSGGTGQ